MIKNIVINPTLLNGTGIENPTWIDPLNTKKIINMINENENVQFHVYDITCNARHNNNDIISISDHINQTGHNPLIGYQKDLPSPFTDISNLYKDTGGVTTNCIGKNFNHDKNNPQYPSTYLCYIPIILKALKKETTHGFLINTL
jgi:hypothetical protein